MQSLPCTALDHFLDHFWPTSGPPMGKIALHSNVFAVILFPIVTGSRPILDSKGDRSRGRFWTTSGPDLGQARARFWHTSGPVWDRFGATFGPLPVPLLGHFWGHFGATFGATFGSLLGPLLGSLLGHFWDHFSGYSRDHVWNTFHIDTLASR